MDEDSETHFCDEDDKYGIMRYSVDDDNIDLQYTLFSDIIET